MAVTGSTGPCVTGANFDLLPSVLHQKTICYWRKISNQFLNDSSQPAIVYQGSWDNEGTTFQSDYWRITDSPGVAFDNSDWYLRFNVAFSGGTAMWKVTPGAVISLETWYFYAWTYDDTSTVNNPTFYLNAVSRTINRVDAPSGTVITDAGINRQAIGFGTPEISGTANTLDDLRIYDRILPGAEIKYLYLTRGKDADNYGLVARYKLDGGKIGFNAPMKDWSQFRHDGNTGVLGGALSYLNYGV